MTDSLRLPSIWMLLSFACLLLLGFFLLYPLLTVFAGSFGQGEKSGWMLVASDPKYARAVINSLVLAASVTGLACLIGVPLAWCSARYDFPGKTLVAMLPLITLVIPEVISAQTWLMLLGNNGVITQWLSRQGFNPPSFYGWFGLITVMSFTYYTYIYIGTLAAIRGFDIQLEEAAQILGTSPFMSRINVVLPIVLPAILSSALLVFTLVLGNFAVAMILGHKIELLSVMTYQAAVSESGSDPALQSALASLSIVIVMGVLFIQRHILSGGRRETTQGRKAVPVRLRHWRGMLIGGLAALVIVISLMPLGVLVAGAFTRARGPVMRWGEWTFANVERVLNNAPDPLINSLVYSLCATVIGIVLSTLISYLIVKKRNSLTPVLDYVAMLPLALSGTAIGISLLMTFNNGVFSISGTAGIIVLAYIMRRFPLGVRNASSTLFNIHDSIEEASIGLGVAPFRSFVNVVLPLMVPAIMAATILTWTTTVAELSASIIVYSGGRETLPIQIFRLIDSGLMAQASVYGLILVLMIILPILVVTRIMRVDLLQQGR